MDDASANSTPSSSNNTMYLVIGAVVVVLLLGVVGFAFKDQIMALMGVPAQPVAEETTSPTPAPQTAEPPAPSSEEESDLLMAPEEVVNFGGKAFSPASIVVKKGQQVRFVQTGTVHMEVASAPHPEHTAYPGFDQSKDAVQKDKNEYVFTFEKVGKWAYHNHSPFVSGVFGSVEVTE